MIDNVLAHGSTYEEYDERLEAVLNRLQSAGVTLNKEKIPISEDQCTVFGPDD